LIALDLFKFIVYNPRKH